MGLLAAVAAALHAATADRAGTRRQLLARLLYRRRHRQHVARSAAAHHCQIDRARRPGTSGRPFEVRNWLFYLEKLLWFSIYLN